VAQQKRRASSTVSEKVPRYDMLAALVCYVTRFTQMFIQVNLETTGGAFSQKMVFLNLFIYFLFVLVNKFKSKFNDF
jgi:hypothetical protein